MVIEYKTEASVVAYVLGFAFSDTAGGLATQRVLLRRHEADSGPEAVRGKFNGLGGKIEDGELPVRAMRREFREESGLDVAEDRWEATISFSGDGWCVGCFRVRLYAYEIAHIEARARDAEARRAEPELLMKEMRGDYNRFDTCEIVPNLRWLVPLHADPQLLSGNLTEVGVQSVTGGLRG